MSCSEPGLTRDLERTEGRPLLHAIKECNVEGVRAFILAFLVVYWSPAFSEIDRSAYRYSTIDEVIAKHELRVGTSEISEKDSTLIAPEFKYRLQLRATGRIRELTPDAVTALSAWSRIHADLPAFLKEYTHQVEVAVDDKPVWLIWQRYAMTWCVASSRKMIHAARQPNCGRSLIEEFNEEA